MLPGYTLPERTRVFCTGLHWFTLLVAVVFIVMLFTENGAEMIIDQYWNALAPEVRDAVRYTEFKRGLVYGVGALAWLNGLLLFAGIWRVFRALANGAPFALPVVRAIRFLGLLILVHLAISLSITPLMNLAMTFDNENGQRVLAISTNTGHAQLLMLGGLFLVLGQVFTEAVRLSDENRQIV